MMSIKYMVHVLAQDGLKVSDEKGKAVVNTPSPPAKDNSQMRFPSRDKTLSVHGRKRTICI